MKTKRTIEMIRTDQLPKEFYIFGNKGTVWSNRVHIAECNSHTGGTLCGTPMLSTNWARIEGMPEIRCSACLEKLVTLYMKRFELPRNKAISLLVSNL